MWSWQVDTWFACSVGLAAVIGFPIKLLCASTGPEDLTRDAAESDETLRRRFIAENLQVLQSFSADLLPLMLQVYGGTVMSQVGDQGVTHLLLITQWYLHSRASGGLTVQMLVVDRLFCLHCHAFSACRCQICGLPNKRLACSR